MTDVECPHCGEEQEVCNDDAHGCIEGVAYEEQCFACERFFIFETCISFEYYPAKADCLNGWPHVPGYYSRPHYRQSHRDDCRDCDHSGNLTPAFIGEGSEFGTPPETALAQIEAGYQAIWEDIGSPLSPSL